MQGKGRGRGAPPTATERNLEVTSPALVIQILSPAFFKSPREHRKAATSSWSANASVREIEPAVEATVIATAPPDDTPHDLPHDLPYDLPSSTPHA